MFDYPFKIAAKRLSLLLPFYFIFRLAFYLLNREIFDEATFAQTLGAFLHGLRFDLSVILLLNLPFIFFSIFPPDRLLQNKTYQLILKILFGVINIPFFYLNIIDTEYFKFIGRRSSDEIFTITQDIIDQSGHLLFNYWYFVLAWFLAGFILLFIYPKYESNRPYYLKYWLLQKILSILFVTIVCVLGIRGGTQYKPLRVNHAFIHEPPTLGNLALNSTFTFIRSFSQVSLEKKNYYPDQAAIAKKLNFDPEVYIKKTEPPVRNNVVIIILESWASEYNSIENNGGGYTPFFDSLAAKGTLFRENYANGKRSIMALPSILAGLPSLMDEPFISSAYESDQVFGFGSILQNAGYATSFFHGAINGTMGFNGFTKSIGIQKYFGLDEYPVEFKERDWDGLWGIHDEPYLQYVVEQLNKEPKPFATAIFTLSSHDPYDIPEKHQNRFPNGNLQIHESIGYTDYALRQFFKSAAKQPWYQNTLFILTGDHTQKTKRKGYRNKIGAHKVPLVLFHPGQSFSFANTHKITQHTDILPTIVDYLNIKTNRLLPFGQSVLDTTSTGRALFHLEGVTSMVEKDYITELWPDDKIRLYQYQTHGFKKLPKPLPEIEQQKGESVKAYVQYFRNGLVDNNLYYWLKPTGNLIIDSN